jgi:hypothetical protein
MLQPLHAGRGIIAISAADTSQGHLALSRCKAAMIPLPARTAAEMYCVPEENGGQFANARIGSHISIPKNGITEKN